MMIVPQVLQITNNRRSAQHYAAFRSMHFFRAEEAH
jgi:hypothetical protein